jgi:prepilin-type N-terminal cleavage/methylation domain-containing protein
MRKGFTLIEILIVVAISAMLSAIALGYTGVARNQIALSVETSKVAGFILRAKQLAIATYNQGSNVCAYGVSFDIADNTYSIFAFAPDPSMYAGPVPACRNIASTTAVGISSSTEMLESVPGAWNVPLANGVRMRSGGQGDDLSIVLFYPPAPETFISRDGETFLNPNTTNVTSKVHLVTADGSASTSIAVNSAGQVNF